ncbi:DUF1289 domain-containing protein [Providencia burhodogranariea]|uniref:Oxidoreductase n=1 Tax=Providencia burhodogranariea DSM 19968 TaxID=1141662 RepID=K8X260_9GAMM|nr:DUF1289 domain-containing protein [Providencia burhodogranariea]EKT62570.1 hypothetical protein OOA_07173 [Providencia burhodogranariea DSM 19968]
MIEQLEFFEIQSPCRAICQTNEQGYCRGCFRSRDERFEWLKYTDAQKRNVLRLCRQRYIRATIVRDVEDDISSTQQELF